jgi:acyl-coenzyme A synthetase/AMP-(fatty) acid ligase
VGNYYRILGRVDDVMKVAGHRLGTKGLESASLSVDEIAESAAVPVVDDVRGRVVLNSGFGLVVPYQVLIEQHERDECR